MAWSSAGAPSNVLEPTPGLDGKLVRLGPLHDRDIKKIVQWLHAKHGGTNRYRDLSDFGYGGYKGPGFKALGIRVEHGMYVLELELTSDMDAMELWLQWA